MLILPIKKKWFDMILSGEKKEDYREVKPYYMSRFSNVFMCPYTKIPEGLDYQQIMFKNGYSKNSPSFIANCTLDVRNGKQEWGAVRGVEYYVLKIDKIVWKSTEDIVLGADRKTEDV